MKTSQRGINDLILSEGLRTTAYKDSVGVWTIGVGHTAAAGAPIPKAGLTITRQQAVDLLASDLVKYETPVDAVLGTVPQNVFDGAVSFHFNTGSIKTATWPKKYKAGDIGSARVAFLSWNKPPEIIGRRKREAALIFDGVYATKPVGASPATQPAPPDVPEPIPAPIPPAPAKPAGKAAAGAAAIIVAAGAGAASSSHPWIWIAAGVGLLIAVVGFIVLRSRST